MFNLLLLTFATAFISVLNTLPNVLMFSAPEISNQSNSDHNKNNNNPKTITETE